MRWPVLGRGEARQSDPIETAVLSTEYTRSASKPETENAKIMLSKTRAIARIMDWHRTYLIVSTFESHVASDYNPGRFYVIAPLRDCSGLDRFSR